MIVGIAEFILLQMPMNFALVLSNCEAEKKSFKLQSSIFVFCYAFIAIDVIINPLLLSFISFKPVIKCQTTKTKIFLSEQT